MKPLVLFPAKGLFVSGMFVAAFALMGGLASLKAHPITGACIIVVMGLCLLCSPLVLIKKWPSLAITEEGISYGGLEASIFSVSWRDVTAIHTGWSGMDMINTKWNKFVYIDYRRDNCTKCYPVLPRIFGMKAEDLAAMMTPYYQKARHAPTVSPD